ncbi:MAG: cysteine desulfurase family protein [Candidatus Paceibacterota bacterium]|jgi:cysteine desulfurase
MNKGKRIYFDNSATTPVRKEALLIMKRFFDVDYGNASSIHKEGVVARKVLDNARTETSQALNARPQDIIFTPSGTAGNNIALLGVVEYLHRTGMRYEDMHAVTTNIEHSSVREIFEEFTRRGVSITTVAVKENGIVSPREIRDALKRNTVLVSVMYANNEIGTIQPIREIAKEVRHFKKHVLGVPGLGQTHTPYFHTDACQAPLYLSLDTAVLGADLIVVDGQKIYGPKGVGALWIRKGIFLSPILFGGGQEKGLYPGTENIPLIAGFSRAFSLAQIEFVKESARLTILRDFCISEIERNFPTTIINGDKKDRLPNNINISFPDYDTEFLVLQLDANGIACSTKSACALSGTGSYVVSSLGGEDWRSRNTLRISFGRDTRKDDIQILIKTLKRILNKDL